MRIRDAGAADRDLVVEGLLAQKSPLFEWTVAAADDPAVAARALAAWNFDVALATGGILVLDDATGCLLWGGTQRGEAAKRLVSEGTRVGRMLYPSVPVACQQRLYDVGRATRTRRVADVFSRPIRFGGVTSPTGDLRMSLLRVLMERVGPLERECIAVTTDTDPVSAELELFGFRVVRDVAAAGSRPRLHVLRRPVKRVL